MSYKSDVTQIAIDFMIAHPHLRTGQAFFNALYKYDREQANIITGGMLDPFYNNLHIEKFMEMLERQGNSLTIHG